MAPPKPYDLGILFVHGMGLQARADTMVHWGESLRKCLGEWIGGASGDEPAKYVKVSDALIRQDPADPGAPAHSKWIVNVPEARRQNSRSTWLVAESWWAEAFATPQYADLASWSFRILPWTLASHFGTRIRRAGAGLRDAKGFSATMAGVMPVLPEFAYFMVSLALMPLIVSLVLLLLVIGLIPIPKVRSVAGAFQRTLAATIGDSFVLLDSPIQAAAIMGHVRRDLQWLAGRCKRVAVVAHSQGAAISHAVLHVGAPREVRLLVTLGSGLNKLSEIRRVKETEKKWMPWVALTGFLILVVSAQGPIHLLRAVKPLELVGWFVLYVLLASLALRILETGWRLRKWLAAVPGALALTACGFFMHHLFSRAETMAFVFAGGAALLLTGAAPAWQRGLGMDAFRDHFQLRRIRWLDFYASADPVPNGPLVDESEGSPMETEEVHNRGSALADHTTYWKNYDGFVSRILGVVARQAGVRLESLTPRDPACLEAGLHRRQWRVRCLRAVRLALAVLAGIVIFARWRDLNSLVESIPPGMVEKAYWVGRLAQKLKLVPEAWSLNGAQQSNQAIGVCAVLLAAVLVYYMHCLIWAWWTSGEVKDFFARRDFRVVTVPSALLCFLLALTLENGLLVAAGWGREIPGSLIRAVPAAMLVSGLSVAWRFWRTLFSNDWTATFRLHVGALAGRTAVAVIVFIPAYLADELIYGPKFPRGEWSHTGPISGFCLLATLLVLICSGKMLRSRPGLWIHRHLQAWSYAGDLIEVWNDILVRRAGILLNDGERLLELRRDVARESSREDLASGKVEALQQFQARLNSLLERQVEVAEGIARQLDANSRRDQIHELHEFAARAQLGPRTTQANSATL